jgi:hypothetical protein
MSGDPLPVALPDLLPRATGGFRPARCYHTARLSLDELPEWDWYDISAHLRCRERDSVGYVDTRRDLSEVINFNKGISS